MELIVYTNMGRTYSFKGVKNFRFTTQGFEFDYHGVSTGVDRHANFNNTCVCGYAMSEEVDSSCR